MLALLSLLLTIIILIVFTKCLIKNSLESNFLSIFILVQIYYVFIPATYSIYFGVYLDSYLGDYNQNTDLLVLIFMSYLTILALLSYVLMPRISPMKVNYRIPKYLYFFLLSLLVFTSTAQMLSVLLNYDELLKVALDRSLINSTYQMMNSKSLFKSLFPMVFFISIYLSITRGNLYYFLFVFPYLSFDILTLGREHIFLVLLSWYLCRVVLEKKRHLFLMSVLVFFLIGLGIIRTLFVHDIDIDFQLIASKILGEGLITWSTLSLAEGGGCELSFMHNMHLFFSGIVPDTFGVKPDFRIQVCLASLSPLDNWGLASSIISEFYSSDLLSRIMMLILFSCLSFSIVVLPSRIDSCWLMCTLILYISFLRIMMRSSFYEIYLYPLYIATVFGGVVLFFEFVRKNAQPD